MKVSALLIAGMAAVLVEASRLEHKDIAKVPTEGNRKPCNDGCGEAASSDVYEEISQRMSWEGRRAAGNSKMEKILSLVREASPLDRRTIIKRILELDTSVDLAELNQVFDLVQKLETFKDEMIQYYIKQGDLYPILISAAEHGYLHIIRSLLPKMEATVATRNQDSFALKLMMVAAGKKNQRSVLDFLLFKSGTLYMRMAQKYVNHAFEAAVGGGNIKIMKLLVGDDNAGNPVAPNLSLTKLNWMTVCQAIGVKNWDSIKHLEFLKKTDRRFANFNLVDADNFVLVRACQAGNYELVDYLFQKDSDGKLVFPLTNPAAKDNQPLVSACSGGNVQIVKKFLERDISGKYLYEGIDPSAQNYQGLIYACRNGHKGVVQVLLEMDDGKYVLPGMEGVNLGRALLEAVEFGQVEVVEFLLTMNDAGLYVLPGIKDVSFTPILKRAGALNRIAVAEFLLKMKNGKYLLPEMNGVDLNCALSAAISAGGADVVELLLCKDSDGSYLYPGVKLTKEMIIRARPCFEMKILLEKHLGQGRIDVWQHFPAPIASSSR